MDKYWIPAVLFLLSSFVVGGAAIASNAPSSNKVVSNMGLFCNPQRNDEPSILEKFGRRMTVFRVAASVYIDYQFAKRTAHRLHKRLGFAKDDPAADDHPQVIELWNSIHAKNALELTNRIKQLEGFWVKVGQYLSSRADVLPAPYLIELATLTDSMPPRPYKDIQKTLQEEFSEEDLGRIDYIDPEPLATASLAQVHRARLSDGQEVVLKVQHRGVASLMRQDMDNLKFILGLLAKMEPDWDFDPVVREYNKEVIKELDFRTEAQNMEEIQQMLRDANIQAIIPNVILGLVQERVFVMEFCMGFPIRQIDQLDKHKVDRRLLLERICSAWAVQMHGGGLFNADPHMGNILVSTKEDNPDASVPVLLDFGLTKRLDPPMKIAFSRLMHASDETDVDSLLLSFEEMGLKMNGRRDPFEDMAAMQRSFRETVPQDEAKAVSAKKSKEHSQRLKALKEEQGLDEKQKLRSPIEAWPAELVFFGRVTNLLRGLCSRLQVRYPYLHTMATVARKTLQETVPEKERATQLIYPTCVTDGTQLQRRLVEAIEDLHAKGQMVGLQINVRHKGKEVANLSAGVLGTANPRPMKPDTLVNIFSAAKALLSIGILRLVQDGKVALDDSVCKHWPAFGKPEITVRHILTHQAGLANALPEEATLDTLLDWFGMREHMTKATPEHEPGTRTMYHYLTYCWLCGGIIEHVTGEHYDEYLHKILSDCDASDLHLGGLPNGMNHDELAVLSVYRPPVPDESTLKAVSRNEEESAKTFEPANGEADNKEKKPSFKKVLAKYKGREQLLNPSVFNMKKVRQAKLPSANVHASAASLARVLDSLSTDLSPLRPDLVKLARERPKNQITEQPGAQHQLLDDADSYFGLGFQVHEFNTKGDLFSKGEVVRSLGHAGLGGSVILTIPEKQLTVAFTANQLDQQGFARNRLMSIVFEEFGLETPSSMKR